MALADWKTAATPAGWRGLPISEVISLPTGQVDPRFEPYRSMVLVAPDHIESGTGTLLAKVTAADQGAISGKYLFAPGDTLYSKIRPYLRKAVFADFAGLTSADMYPLRPAPGIEPRFLTGVILSEHFSRFAEIVSMRSGFPKINREELAEYGAAIPPLPEQRQIAAILDTVDDAIRKTEQIIAKLKQVKHGLLHDLLSRGIDDNGELRDPERHPEQFKESPLGRIPRGWELRELGDVLSRIDAGWSPACVEVPPTPGVWGVLKVSAVTSGEFLSHESKTLPEHMTPIPDLEVREGDVILARANGVADLVGITVEATTVQPHLMLSDKLLRLVPQPTRLVPSFLGYAMKGELIRGQVARIISGSSGQKNVSQSHIRGFLLPLPPTAEQTHSAQLLRAHGNREAKEVVALDKLRLLKAGLMEDLLTGRVRVTKLLESAAE